MSYLDYNTGTVPAGPRKILHFSWGLAVTLTAIAGIGFLTLYSVAGGSFTPWAGLQMKRYALGFAIMFFVALVPIRFWRDMSAPAYLLSILLLAATEFLGVESKGAQRWLDLGFTRFQPSEPMKIAQVMTLAAYYDRLPLARLSHPLQVAVPVFLIALPVVLVLRQPDLGTAVLLAAAGALIMFAAGVHWAWFAAVTAAAAGMVTAVFRSRGADWQLLSDYQYRRIDTFFDPASDPLGAGYHITQSKIALGAGGWTGRGFLQGTQSQLNFLPEQHTDFIFTPLGEEFGFVGTLSLLGLYTLILAFCLFMALSNRNRFAALLTLGVAITFFLFFAVNMSMVMGLAPVVGIPLPLVSHGGSAMLVLMLGFGLVQSAHIHKRR